VTNDQRRKGDATRARQGKDPVVVAINEVRSAIKTLAFACKAVKTGLMTEAAFTPEEDRPEVLANLTLAYRCLEDASMRCGKAIQARDGGVSVYDRDTTVGA
jgi:hypothetical protein